MKTKVKAAPIEVLQLLLVELRSLTAVAKDKIRAANARVRKPGPRTPRKVKRVSGKFVAALKPIP
jgi:hypothetical protein